MKVYHYYMITSIKYFDVSQIERGSHLEEIIPTASIHIKKYQKRGRADITRYPYFLTKRTTSLAAKLNSDTKMKPT